MSPAKGDMAPQPGLQVRVPLRRELAFMPRHPWCPNYKYDDYRLARGPEITQPCHSGAHREGLTKQDGQVVPISLGPGQSASSAHAISTALACLCIQQETPIAEVATSYWWTNWEASRKTGCEGLVSKIQPQSTSSPFSVTATIWMSTIFVAFHFSSSSSSAVGVNSDVQLILSPASLRRARYPHSSYAYAVSSERFGEIEDCGLKQQDEFHLKSREVNEGGRRAKCVWEFVFGPTCRATMSATRKTVRKSAAIAATDSHVDGDSHAVVDVVLLQDGYYPASRRFVTSYSLERRVRLERLEFRSGRLMASSNPSMLLTRCPQLESPLARARSQSSSLSIKCGFSFIGDSEQAGQRAEFSTQIGKHPSPVLPSRTSSAQGAVALRELVSLHASPDTKPPLWECTVRASTSQAARLWNFGVGAARARRISLKQVVRSRSEPTPPSVDVECDRSRVDKMLADLLLKLSSAQERPNGGFGPRAQASRTSSAPATRATFPPFEPRTSIFNAVALSQERFDDGFASASIDYSARDRKFVAKSSRPQPARPRAPARHPKLLMLPTFYLQLSDLRFRVEGLRVCIHSGTTPSASAAMSSSRTSRPPVPPHPLDISSFGFPSVSIGLRRKCMPPSVDVERGTRMWTMCSEQCSLSSHTPKVPELPRWFCALRGPQVHQGHRPRRKTRNLKILRPSHTWDFALGPPVVNVEREIVSGRRRACPQSAAQARLFSLVLKLRMHSYIWMSDTRAARIAGRATAATRNARGLKQRSVPAHLNDELSDYNSRLHPRRPIPQAQQIRRVRYGAREEKMLANLLCQPRSRTSHRWIWSAIASVDCAGRFCVRAQHWHQHKIRSPPQDRFVAKSSPPATRSSAGACELFVLSTFLASTFVLGVSDRGAA
ncbi:hypothetical protein C8F04DRAFT_1306274 [Mycena alexandri]|uniref:Uncharacterized protein n=1 Tax=Mycena alexandri TaxID=1745969 RepID=A0AAD6S8H0_9AGAR|nr:hypothetical protein C8F04DRAFT_1306274 [Mycena alexandri]